MELALNQHQLKTLQLFQNLYLYCGKELIIEEVCNEIVDNSQNKLEQIDSNELLNSIFLQKLEKLNHSLLDTSDYVNHLKEILFGFGKLIKLFSYFQEQHKLIAIVTAELSEQFEHLLKVYENTNKINDEDTFFALLELLDDLLISNRSKLTSEIFEALKQKICQFKSRYKEIVKLVLEKVLASFGLKSNQSLTKDDVLIFLKASVKKTDDVQEQDDIEKLIGLDSLYLKAYYWLTNNLNAVDEKIISLDKKLRENFAATSQRFFLPKFTETQKLPFLANLKIFREFVYLSCLPQPNFSRQKISDKEKIYNEAWQRCMDSAALKDNNQLDFYQQELLKAFWDWQLKDLEKRKARKKRSLGSNYWFITENDLSTAASKGLTDSIEKLLNESTSVSLDKDDDRTHIQIFCNTNGQKLLVNNKRGNTRNSLSTKELAVKHAIAKITEQQGLLAIIQIFIFYATSKNTKYLGENELINQFFNITNKNFEIVLSEHKISFRLRAQTSSFAMRDYGAEDQKFFFDISFDVVGSNFKQVESFKFNFSTDNKNAIELNPATLKPAKKKRLFSNKLLKAGTEELPWQLLPESHDSCSLTSSTSSGIASITREDEVSSLETSSHANDFAVSDNKIFEEKSSLNSGGSKVTEVELQQLKGIIENIRKDKVEKGIIAIALDIFAKLDEQQKKLGNDNEALALITNEKKQIYQELFINPNSDYVLSQRRTDILLWDDSEGIKRENELAILKDANKSVSKNDVSEKEKDINDLEKVIEQSAKDTFSEQKSCASKAEKKIYLDLNTKVYAALKLELIQFKYYQSKPESNNETAIWKLLNDLSYLNQELLTSKDKLNKDQYDELSSDLKNLINAQFSKILFLLEAKKPNAKEFSHKQTLDFFAQIDKFNDKIEKISFENKLNEEDFSYLKDKIDSLKLEQYILIYQQQKTTCLFVISERTEKFLNWVEAKNIKHEHNLINQAKKQAASMTPKAILQASCGHIIEVLPEPTIEHFPQVIPKNESQQNRSAHYEGSSHNRLKGNTPYKNNLLNQIGSQVDDEYYVQQFVEKRQADLYKLNSASITLVIANAIQTQQSDARICGIGVTAKVFYKALNECTKGPKSILSFMFIACANFIKKPGIGTVVNAYRQWQMCKQAEQLRVEFLNGYGAYVVEKKAEAEHNDLAQTEIQSLQSIFTMSRELESAKQQIITKLGRKDYPDSKKMALFADAARCRLEMAVENKPIKHLCC